jgi:peptidoglycan/xylan/chitin deacetylase (PgdA/CDA1 family)
VLIVAYHRVVPNFDELRERVIPALLTSVPVFERQLATLSTSYRVVPLGEALDVLGGRAKTDRDLCVITFDDGYVDFQDHALPVLQRLGFPATLYVATGYIGGSTPLLHDRLYSLLRSAEHARVSTEDVHPALAVASGDDPATAVNRLLERWSRAVCLEVAEALERALGADPEAALCDSRLLSWDQLRSLRAAGVEIGAHTVDHVCLHHEGSIDVAGQLRESKERLQLELGWPVVDFAYPNGWYSPSVTAAVREAGYRSAVTTEDRLNTLGESPYVLKRKIAWEFTSRGVRGFSRAVAACNFDDTFATVGLSTATPGEKPDRS